MFHTGSQRPLRTRLWLPTVAAGFLKHTALEASPPRFSHVRLCPVFWESPPKANCLHSNRVSGLALGNPDEADGHRENLSVQGGPERSCSCGPFSGGWNPCSLGEMGLPTHSCPFPSFACRTPTFNQAERAPAKESPSPAPGINRNWSNMLRPEEVKDGGIRVFHSIIQPPNHPGSVRLQKS